MELAKYKACICEGSAEEAIIDILVDNDLLIFNREEMLEERVIRCRSAKRFEERYLLKYCFTKSYDFTSCIRRFILQNSLGFFPERLN